MESMFTVTAKGEPVSIVVAGNAEGAVSMTERLLETGDGAIQMQSRLSNAVLRPRRPTDLEAKSFFERQRRWRGETRLAGILIE